MVESQQQPPSTTYSHRKEQIKQCFNSIFVNLYIKPVGVIIYLLSLILLIVILSTLALVVHPVEIDFSLSSLIVPTHHASIKLQSYLAAKHAMANGMEEGSFIRSTANQTNYHGVRRKRGSYLTSTFRAPPGLTFQIPHSQTALYPFWTLDIVFIAAGDNSNMLTEDRIQYVKYVEQEVTQHKDYSRFCLMTRSKTYEEGWQCTPPNSITTYFYPSIVNGERVFDGNGPRSKDSITDVLKYAFSISPKSYWFVDEEFTPQNMRTNHIRSQFLFGFPIKGYRDWSYTREEQRRLYKEFIISYIPILENKNTDSVKVYFGSTDLYDHQAYTLFLEDLQLALGALAIVYLYMSLHTFSFVLAFFAGGCILGSVGVTYFIIRVILGHVKMNVLNGISLFVILGIGVDDAFVFIDTYKQMGYIDDPRKRLKKTFEIAGKATLFTSATTAVAYSANIFSKIPAVSNFGYCMSFLVITCYVIVTLLMPAVLSIWTMLGLERKERHFEEWCGRPFTNMFPWCNTTDSIFNVRWSSPRTAGSPRGSGWRVAGADVPGAGAAATTRETTYRSDGNARDYENLTSNNLYDRLGDLSTCAVDEPLYEVMSGENIYDRVDIGAKERHEIRQYHRTRSGSKMEDSDSGVDPEEGSDESLSLKHKGKCDEDPYINVTDPIDIDIIAAPKSSDGLSSLTWLQKVMRNILAPFIIRMRYVSILVFALILAFSVWGGTQIQTPNHPPEIFPRDSNIQHFINLSYDFVSTERCDKCSGYFADQEALKDRAENLPKETVRPETPLNGGTSTGTKGHQGEGIDSGSSRHDPPNGDAIAKDESISHMATSYPDENNPETDTKLKPNEKNEYIIPVDVLAKDEGVVDLCKDNICTLTHTREDSASTAEVLIVFGIKGVDMSQMKEHVNSQGHGIPIFDERFRVNRKVMERICTVCKNTLSRTDLVRNMGVQQDCLDICDSHKILLVSKVRKWIPRYLGFHEENNITMVDWIALPFRSTTPNSISNCKAYHHWKKWEDFIKDQTSDETFPDELKSVFQTSERWSHVFTEVVLVDGAIRGIAISLWFCIMATIIFTGHPIQTLIVMSTIICEIGFVFGCFFMVGLELGAVEAISLAILVGTSVDYCVHLVEGYRIAGKATPPTTWTGTIRAWRLRHALNHIGVPIVSSAVTTVLAAVVLSVTQIQMFSRFGKILAITMFLSLIYTLFMAGSLLTVFAPIKYSGSGKASLKGLAVATVLTCCAIPLPLYLFKEAIIC